MNHSPTAVPSAVENITVMVGVDDCPGARAVHTTHTPTVPLLSAAVYSIISSVYKKPSGKMNEVICTTVEQVGQIK